MGILKYWRQIVCGPWWWAEAEDLVAQHKFLEAKSYVEKIYAAFEVSAPSVKATVETNLLMARIYCGLDECESAISCARVVLMQLNDGSNGYNNESADYIKYYCRWVIEYCADGNYDILREFMDLSNVKYSSLNIKRIRPNLLKNFAIGGALPSDR